MDQSLQRAFNAELARLLYVGLTQEEEVIARRYYSDKERKSMDEGDFCGPHKSFPIKTQADVENAAHLIGKADNPDAVKRCIIGKAKANGWSIPDAWKEDGKEDRAAEGALTRAGNHEPMTGSHSHAHPAYGSQGDDGNHEHDHSHDGDADHHHAHAERSAENATPEALHLYAPIVRMDEKDWLIEGQVTSDQVDHYGTIFDYEASKAAFETWRGNIREMHQNKAVGRAVEVIPDDATRTIFLRARISRGARDTWEKVLDGTLSGFSVSASPRDVETTSLMRNGKSVPVYKVKRWAEVSVVDNPGSPGCDFTLVRADGLLTDLINTSEEDAPATPDAPIERAGARVSADTMAAMHENIGHTLQAAMKQMKNCGCADCQAAMKELDPDGDGDIDAFGGMYGDTDGDAASLYSDDDGMDRAMISALERVLPGLIERHLSPAYSRLQGIAGTMARTNSAPPPSLDAIITEAITRALDAAKAANESSASDLRADLAQLQKAVKHIEDTPVPGAPIQNAGAAPRPVEKRLATDPYQRPPRSGSAVYDAIAGMSEAGLLDSPEKQANAVAAGFIAQRQGR